MLNKQKKKKKEKKRGDLMLGSDNIQKIIIK